MSFNKITSTIIQQFNNCIGEKYVSFDKESLDNYSHDETEDLSFLPEVVLKPRTANEISEILKICNKESIPATPRGAGTGLSGGALPVHGGAIISTERLNTIIQIDERNMQATVEP